MSDPCTVSIDLSDTFTLPEWAAVWAAAAQRGLTVGACLARIFSLSVIAPGADLSTH